LSQPIRKILYLYHLIINQIIADMKTINWSGRKWITQERWGEYHPDKLNVWFDETAVKINNSGHLELSVHINPKVFHTGGNTVKIPIGIGMVSCTDKLGYGLYEIEAKLPVGKNLYPTFWMYSFDSWPPEIDVFEAVSDNNYFRPFMDGVFSIWALKSNVHYDENGAHKDIKGRQGWFGLKNPGKHFMKYSVLWTPDKIEIKYNGNIVRTITEPKIVGQMRGKKMNVLIGHAITDNNTSFFMKTPYIIRSFRYAAQ